jgi:hypothetical protein
MTCPQLNPSLPPLSYSVASFQTGDYDNPKQIINPLVGAGFKVLTLIPTFEARTHQVSVTYPIGGEERHFRVVDKFHSGRTPSIDSIRALAVAGIEAGMHVRFEPHVDADVSLQGKGETYWRAHLLFDPLASPPGYYDVVLKPIFDLIVAIKDTPIPNLPGCKPCFSLTLGSELEMSLFCYTPRWEEILVQLKTLRLAQGDLDTRLIFGHKINWDHFSRSRLKDWIELINKYNRELQTGGPTDLTLQSLSPRMYSYLSKLDYIGVSFYPPLAGKIGGKDYPKEKWQQPPTDQSVEEMAGLMDAEWQALLKPAEGMGPSVEIGEAGVGNPDAAKPWDTGDPESMNTPEGKNVTRHVVRAVALFTRKHAERFRNKSKDPCMSFMPITYWTVNQCDWLGLREAWNRFKVDDLVAWVKGWNANTFSQD